MAVATFDVNNFVIDRIIRGVGLSQKDGSALFSINQIQNASLNCSSESTDAVDALGTPIATFYRAKNAEFSAENALFDMNLMATQMGTTKKVAGSGAKILTPAMETLEYAGEPTATLKHTPKTIPTEAYKLNGDSTFGIKYKKGSLANETDFTLSGTTFTFPTGLTNGDQIFVMYEYEAEKAVSVVNSAVEFPKGCRFVMEVLGCDVCDQSTLVHAYVVFNNFKLSPDFDWSIATDGAHPFSGKAQQDYCDKEKKLFSIIIPDEAE